MRNILIDNPDILVVRNDKEEKHILSILKNIYVEKGESSDWDLLSELHYKGHSRAAGSRYMRAVFDDGNYKETIGIMVFANPMPLNKGRNIVFPLLKPNSNGLDSTLINKTRMRWINSNITWNNRTVLDTMYRSAGIAYRFKNLAYRMYCCEYGFRFVESNSSMGKFNPFSIKTGMRFVQPKPANGLDFGIEFFRGHFKSHPNDQAAILEELRGMSEAERTFIEKRLREFYHKHSAMEKSGDKMHIGMTRVNDKSIEYILKQTQQIVFSSTIYWIFENPDHRRKLPARLPLLAFDNQEPNEPLRLDLIK
jgi:hypothetical protein